MSRARAEHPTTWHDPMIATGPRQIALLSKPSRQKKKKTPGQLVSKMLLCSRLHRGSRYPTLAPRTPSEALSSCFLFASLRATAWPVSGPNLTHRRKLCRNRRRKRRKKALPSPLLTLPEAWSQVWPPPPPPFPLPRNPSPPCHAPGATGPRSRSPPNPCSRAAPPGTPAPSPRRETADAGAHPPGGGVALCFSFFAWPWWSQIGQAQNLSCSGKWKHGPRSAVHIPRWLHFDPHPTGFLPAAQGRLSCGSELGWQPQNGGLLLSSLVSGSGGKSRWAAPCKNSVRFGLKSVAALTNLGKCSLVLNEFFHQGCRAAASMSMRVGKTNTGLQW